MILTVYTPNVIYTVKGTNVYPNEKVIVNNCTFEQTSYGSVKIIRDNRDNVVELYPSSISHIIHMKS